MARSSMSAPASMRPASVAATLGDPVSVALGNVNSPRPPWPPWAVAVEMPLPGVAMIELSD